MFSSFSPKEKDVISTLINESSKGEEPLSFETIIKSTISEISFLSFHPTIQSSIQFLAGETKTEDSHDDEFKKNIRVYVNFNGTCTNKEEIRSKLVWLLDLIIYLEKNNYIQYDYQPAFLSSENKPHKTDDRLDSFPLFESANKSVEPWFYHYYRGSFYISKNLRELQRRKFRTSEEDRNLKDFWMKLITLIVAIVSLITSIVTCKNDANHKSDYPPVIVTIQEKEPFFDRNWWNRLIPF